MYPTLEIDIDGELVKLKVGEVKQEVLVETLSPPLCSNISSADSELRGADQAHGERRGALHVRGSSWSSQEGSGGRSQRSLAGHRLWLVFDSVYV